MDIKKIAKQWINENINKNEWPEDEWTSLNDEYDMNIYIDEDGKERATVFPVINGETDLETFIEII